jgi:hypothetical protein
LIGSSNRVSDQRPTFVQSLRARAISSSQTAASSATNRAGGPNRLGLSSSELEILRRATIGILQGVSVFPINSESDQTIHRIKGQLMTAEMQQFQLFTVFDLISKKRILINLLALFDPLTLAQPHARAATILIDKFDTCYLESSADFVCGRLPTAQPTFGRFQTEAR